MTNTFTELLEAISTKTRLRIIETLLTFDELTIRKLRDYIKVNWELFKRELDCLEKLGIVEVKQIGKCKIIRLNYRNEKTKLILKLVEKLREIEDNYLKLTSTSNS